MKASIEKNQSKKKTIIQFGLLACVALLISLFFVFDGGQYLQLEFIKNQQETARLFYANNQLLVLFGFFVLYTLVAALSLPAAVVLTLAGGALFGTLLGLIVISFASSIGATIAFLIARFIARDFIQQRYHAQLAKINHGFQQEGAWYLFALRLVPAFPFFMVNIITALMPMKVHTFYWVSQLGMLPGTLVYVYAGTQLGAIESLSDVGSPSLLLAFAALGVFPLIAKKAVSAIRTRRSQTGVGS